MSAAMVTTLPAQNPAAPYRWSGAGPVPEIGARVTISFNGLGAGTVVGYEVTEGWLGVHVRLEKNPAWREEQLKRNRYPADLPAFVYGAELVEQRGQA